MHISRRFVFSLLSSTGWWLGVAVSLVLSLLVTELIEDRAQSEFDYQVNNAQLAIQTRVRSYIDVLRGTAALFNTQDQVNREQFHAYVSQLQLERSFPGIVNLNVARVVPGADKSAFEASVRADRSVDPRGYPDFAIKPAGQRSEYQVLTYIEPMESNLVSFGIDIAANEVGATALASARDSGQITSSGRIIRINGPHHHIGLAMRLPLYRRGMPTGTVNERRAAYYGSLGAGFNISKLMFGAVDKKHMPYMHFRLFDTGINTDRQDGAGKPELLFDSDSPEDPTLAPVRSAKADSTFVRSVSMTIGPRVWDAEFSVDKTALFTRFDRWLPGIVLLAGLIATGLLYSIYYSLMSARRRAVELAKEMTKDLRSSEASLAEAQHMAHLGSWLLDTETNKMTWSAETYHIFGMDRFSESPSRADFLRRVHDIDRARVEKGLEHVKSDGVEFNLEHRIKQRDGTVRWVQTIARMSISEGRILVRGTLMDITERKETVEALKRSQELLRELTAHQDRVKEEERRRIAREIHDELGQTLLALRIDVSMLEARTAKGHPRLNEKVRGALNHIDATVKTIRTIINNLRPAVLDLGLAAAFEWQVAEFRRRSGITCNLVMDEDELNVDDTRATTLFRILQESLTNVIRHSKATRVVIELNKDGDKLVMKITDNGVGIYPGSRKGGNSFGLVGVEERIHALNGRFIINSTPGNGTTLTIFIPLPAAAAEEVPRVASR
jgi:PAS domain S-box-containing protein